MDMRELAYDLYKIDWLQRDGSGLFGDKLKVYYKQYSLEKDKQSLQEYLLNTDNGVLYVGFEEFIDGKYKDVNYIRSLLQDEELFAEYLADKELTAEAERPEPKRFAIVIMDDGADHPYEVWDMEKNACYVGEAGNRAEFMTRWQAEDFASEHNRWVAEHGGIGAEILSPEIQRENAELDAIGNFLDATHIYDITYGFDDGVFSAKDEDITWTRSEFYDFLVNDVIMLDENEKLVPGLYMPDKVLEPIIGYAREAGVTINKHSINSKGHSTEAIADKMELTRFMRELCNMIYDMDKTDVIDWVAYAKYLQEYKNTTFEKVMLELYLPLSFVNNNFKPEIINQVMKNQIPGDEIINCGILYAAGYDNKTIREIGNSEVLAGGYIPLNEDEERTLSLIGIENNPNCIFVAANTGHETIMKCMKKALAVSVLQESELETVLENPDIAGVSLHKISNPKLIDAMIKAVNNSTAFDVVTVLNMETNTVKQYGSENLTTEKIMKLFSEESGGQALGMNGQQ